MSKEVNIDIKGSTEINENPIGLLEASPVYKPFRYPWAYDMWLMQQRLHWLPEEVNMSEDVKDWNNKLDEKEIHLVTQIFRFFTQADCVPIKTRLLTSTGFKEIGELGPDDLVAQVSKDGKLSFVKPLVSSNAIKHKNEGNIVHFTGNGGRFDISVTENHNMVFKRDGEIIKQKAKDVEFKKGDQLIVGVTPTFTGEERELTQIERLKVAFNERGHITKKRGGLVYTFSPSDEHERAYIYRLLHSEMRLPIETEKVKYEGEEFIYLTINSLDDKNKVLECLKDVKSYNWVELDNISSIWCESFIKEIGIYGHVENSSEIRYFSENKNSAEKVQTVALLAGYQAFNKPNTTKLGNKGFSLDIVKQDVITINHVKKEIEKSEEMVSCVKVPEGNILVERNGIPVVTGNCEVNNAYIHIYTQIFKPFEVQMMLTCFANIETIHVAAYSHLLDTIGMPEIEYSAFLKYKAMKDKFESMHDYHITDKKGIALAIATFSGFMEGLQLFASFAILLNFPRYNRLKGMGQIVSWSVRDETIHVMGMIKLFRTFIAENPEIWTDEFRESIRKICVDCVKHEDAFIDLAFELGGVNGLDADEVKRYIRFIADRRLTMMSIEPIYNIEENPLPWVDDMVNAVEHTNFFENRATEYSRAGTTGTWDDAFKNENFLKNGTIPSVNGSKWI